jgi:hypothetical protein
MALREVLAELLVKVTGAEAVDQANAALDTVPAHVAPAGRAYEDLRIAQQRAAQTAAQLTTQIRKVSAAEGENSPRVAEMRRQLVRAQEAARNFGAEADRVRQAQQSAGSGAVGMGLGFLQAAGAVTGVAVSLAAVRAAIVGAVQGIAEITGEVIALGDELGDTSERFGISADSLAQWRFVAQRTGVEVGELDAAMGLFARTIAQADRGGAQAGAFRELGIAIHDTNGELRPTGDLFDETVRRLSEIQNPAERSATAMRLFGRSGAAVAQLAGRNAEELRTLTDRWRELTGGGLGDFVEASGAADDAMADFDTSITVLKTALVGPFLNALADVVGTVATWVGSFVELVRTSNLLEVGLLVLAGILAPFVITMGLLAAAVLIAVAPFVALVLIVEDLYTAFSGGDSIFGRFVERLFEAMGLVADFQAIVQLFGMTWENLLAQIQTATAGILSQVASVSDALGVELVPGVQGAAQRAEREAATARRGVATRRAEILDGSRARLAAREASAPAPATVTARGGRGAQGASVQQTNTHVTHINGTQDPQAVARAVRRENSRLARQAAEQLPLGAPEPA